MNNPVWIDEKGKIIEPEYCRDFLSRHPMRCINDHFYTVEILKRRCDRQHLRNLDYFNSAAHRQSRFSKSTLPSISKSADLSMETGDTVGKNGGHHLSLRFCHTRS